MGKERMTSLAPLVPASCMICGAKWIGGHERPGHRMKVGLRVFYECGASLSIKEGFFEGAFHLLLKNCWCEENAKSMDDYFREREEANARRLSEGGPDSDAGLS